MGLIRHCLAPGIVSHGSVKEALSRTAILFCRKHLWHYTNSSFADVHIVFILLCNRKYFKTSYLFSLFFGFCFRTVGAKFWPIKWVRSATVTPLHLAWSKNYLHKCVCVYVCNFHCWIGRYTCANHCLRSSS